MEKISLEQLPVVVMEIKEQLSCIERSLSKLAANQKEENVLLTVDEAAKFLTLAQSTLYAKVCRSEIPVIKKGKRLYFEKDILIEWLKKGRRKTVDDFRGEAESYFGGSKFKR